MWGESYRIAGNFRKVKFSKHPSKYDFETSQPTSFQKIFSKILQTMCTSYVNNKNERLMLAHEASRGIMLTMIAK